MDFERYLAELDSDKELIYQLHDKYNKLFREHMKKKKPERDPSWDKARTMLFHINGALSMLRSGVGTWLNIRRYGL